MTRKTSYFVYDKAGVNKPGRFPYGTLISAIKLAMELQGVVYTDKGDLRWMDDNVDYQFKVAKHIQGWNHELRRGNYKNVFCICDQCQAEIMRV